MWSESWDINSMNVKNCVAFNVTVLTIGGAVMAISYVKTSVEHDLLLDRTLRRFRDHAIKRRRGCRHCLTIAIALRSVVGSAFFVII